MRVVELLSELRRVGFTDDLGFGPDTLRLYVEMVRSLVREELRVFARGVIGRADSERVRVMAESAIEILNQVIAVMRTSLLLRAIKYGDIPPAARVRGVLHKGAEDSWQGKQRLAEETRRAEVRCAWN